MTNNLDNNKKEIKYIRKPKQLPDIVKSQDRLYRKIKGFNEQRKQNIEIFKKDIIQEIQDLKKQNKENIQQAKSEIMNEIKNSENDILEKIEFKNKNLMKQIKEDKVELINIFNIIIKNIEKNQILEQNNKKKTDIIIKLLKISDIIQSN